MNGPINDNIRKKSLLTQKSNASITNDVNSSKDTCVFVKKCTTTLFGYSNAPKPTIKSRDCNMLPIHKRDIKSGQTGLVSNNTNIVCGLNEVSSDNCNFFVKYVSSNVSECNISSPNCKSEKHALQSGPINEHVCDIPSCQSYRTLQGICGLKILHFNAQSLYPKLDELCFIALDLKLDCISVNETWLNHTFTDASVNVPNFSLFRKDRICSSHGGVALYIKSS